MVTTHHLCAACGSKHIRRNGSVVGHAKYQCKACGHQARFVPAAAARAVRYALGGPALARTQLPAQHRTRDGCFAHDRGRPHKKALAAPPVLTRLRPKRGKKSGGKRLNSMRWGRLWAVKSARCGAGWPWNASVGPGPRPPRLVFHRLVGVLRVCLAPLAPPGCPKGSGGTSIVEAINCSLRQRCSVLVRKSCSFSKSLQMHEMRIKIVIDYYNITLN